MLDLNDIPSFYTELHHTLSNRIICWLFIAIAQQIAIILHVIIITQEADDDWLILSTNFDTFN